MRVEENDPNGPVDGSQLGADSKSERLSAWSLGMVLGMFGNVCLRLLTVRVTLHPVLPGCNLILHKSVSKLD